MRDIGDNWVWLGIVVAIALVLIANSFFSYLRDRAKYRAAAAIGSWPATWRVSSRDEDDDDDDDGPRPPVKPVTPVRPVTPVTDHR